MEKWNNSIWCIWQVIWKPDWRADRQAECDYQELDRRLLKRDRYKGIVLSVWSFGFCWDHCAQEQ